MPLPHVEIFLPPRALGTSFMLCADFFTLAARITLGAAVDPSGAFDDSNVFLRSRDGAPMPTANGTVVVPRAAFDPTARPQLLFFPTFVASPDRVLASHEDVVAWTREVHEAGGLVVAEGAGVYFPAAAGLLDERTAAVLWVFHQHFRQRFPRVRVHDGRLLVESAERLVTACGLNAGCDLALAVIARLHGDDVADRVAQLAVRQTLRSDQAVLAAADARKYHDDEAVLAAQEHIEANLASELSVDELARRVATSRRNFMRRFQRATGETPARYIQRLRVEAAKVLLRDPRKQIAEVAFAVGYADAGAFSRAFKSVTGQTPSELRERTWSLPRTRR